MKHNMDKAGAFVARHEWVFLYLSAACLGMAGGLLLEGWVPYAPFWITSASLALAWAHDESVQAQENAEQYKADRLAEVERLKSALMIKRFQMHNFNESDLAWIQEERGRDALSHQLDRYVELDPSLFDQLIEGDVASDLALLEVITSTRGQCFDLMVYDQDAVN